MQTEQLIELIKSGNPAITEVNLCKDCETSIDIKVIRTGETFEVIPANLPHAIFFIDEVREKKLLVEDGEVSIKTRCTCFTVTDPSGTRIECFLCHEPPDVRCYGPYPYCPSYTSIFPVIDQKSKDGDGSEAFIQSFDIVNNNYACQFGHIRVLVNNHPSRTIRVWYFMSNSTLNYYSDVVPTPRGVQGTFIGCSWGVSFSYVKYEYLT